MWPETASPTVLRRDPELQQTLAGVSADLRSPLLVGSIDVLDGVPRRLSNAAFLVSRQGHRRQV